MICRSIANGRILFVLAGTMTLLSVALAVGVSPWFLALAVMVGVNQLVYARFGACPATLVLGLLPCATRGVSR